MVLRSVEANALEGYHGRLGHRAGRCAVVPPLPVGARQLPARAPRAVVHTCGIPIAAAAADAYSVPCAATGFNPDEVIADIAELRFHTAGTSITDGDNANERPNAHNDAQHCQEAANAVANQRLECFSNYRPQGHE